MPKKFYTEIDIENLAKQGVRSLEIHNGVVVTDVAREKARALGVQLVQSTPAVAAAPAVTTPPQAGASDELAQRIRSAVKARLGDQVDPALLDTVIKRVLANTKLK